MEFNKFKKALKNDFADLSVIKVAVLADSASRRITRNVPPGNTIAIITA